MEELLSEGRTSWDLGGLQSPGPEITGERGEGACGQVLDRGLSLNSNINLTNNIERILSLPAIVKAMVGSETAWKAMVSFCEDVILQKKAAERLREVDPEADPIRKRRGGSEGAARLPQ